MDETFDVVVVGAGPVGLMLACELRLAGVEVLVVERLTEIDQTIKAGAITLPAAQAIYRRGLLERLRVEQDKSPAPLRVAFGVAVRKRMRHRRFRRIRRSSGITRASCCVATPSIPRIPRSPISAPRRTSFW
ncbi:FAD-dependent monooxygenase [Nocardia brasiliensis]|uniref:FAD-dependent monooxygenase n=1 Tax=Nocardia brasiliensis TaxID=37326 RepID=UPI003D92C8B7